MPPDRYNLFFKFRKRGPTENGEDEHIDKDDGDNLVVEGREFAEKFEHVDEEREGVVELVDERGDLAEAETGEEEEEVEIGLAQRLSHFEGLDPDDDGEEDDADGGEDRDHVMVAASSGNLVQREDEMEEGVDYGEDGQVGGHHEPKIVHFGGV